MKRFGIRVIAAYILLISISSLTAAGSGDTKDLVVLHTNDFHGHPLRFFNHPAPDAGGLPAIAEFVNQVREGNPNVLVLDAGDLNTGRPESNFFKAAPDIIGYNYIGYDAMVAGNHEFDNPLSILQKQRRLARFPLISANVKTDDGNYLFEPYIIKNFDDFKVGIFGLTTKETEVIGNPDHIKNIRFEDEVAAAKKVMAELKGKVDVIIALVHMGVWENDLKGSRRLAAEVAGIDLIIDGHTHTDLREPLIVAGMPIVQAWQWGLKVGKGKLSLRNGKVSDFRWESVPINLKRKDRNADGSDAFPFIGRAYEEDPFLLSLLTPFADRVNASLSEVIGESKETYFSKTVRMQETELGDLVSDAMRWFTKNLKPDFAIQNGGGIRADLPEGKITKKSIHEILPFDNSIVVLKLRGHQIKELFDYIATIPSGKGGFPQVSEGVRFTIDYTARKCENISIDGSPIDPERTYTIATNSYMAAGGDGYRILENAEEKYDTSVFLRDAVIEYIIHLGGILKPEPKQRINLILGLNLGPILGSFMGSLRETPEGEFPMDFAA